MEINRILVCGAGTMGSGIALACAQGGFYTLLYEVNPAVLDQAKSSISKNLSNLVSRGKINEEAKNKTLQRIAFTDDLQQCLADIVIEAIIEKAEFKIALFNQLAEINHGETIFATNTSSLSVTAIAEKIVNSERVIGMHFFNPATIMKLVEIVLTELTDEQTKNAVIDLSRKLGKTPVICKDSPGFIVNRVARPYYIEALRLVEENQVSFDQADRLLENAGFKMGPFKLMDLIGNDINYAVSSSVYEQLNKPERLRPSDIQRKNVEEGRLGKKTGEGYFKY
jgi:3-hydroxybutyryl-CoA dehydrogenase